MNREIYSSGHITRLDGFDKLWRSKVILDATFHDSVQDVMGDFNYTWMMPNGGLKYGIGGIVSIDDLFVGVKQCYTINSESDNAGAKRISSNADARINSVINFKYGEMSKSTEERLSNNAVKCEVIFTITDNMTCKYNEILCKCLDAGAFILVPRVDTNLGGAIKSVITFDLHIDNNNRGLYDYCKRTFSKFENVWQRGVIFSSDQELIIKEISKFYDKGYIGYDKGYIGGDILNL